MLFCDPFNMEQQNYYQPATFTPINTGLNRLLSSYGIQLESSYVFDENCYKARQQTMQGIQSFDLYWAPMMSNRELNQKNPITKNLGYVIFLQPGKINTDIAAPDGISSLLRTSAFRMTNLRKNQKRLPFLQKVNSKARLTKIRQKRNPAQKTDLQQQRTFHRRARAERFLLPEHHTSRVTSLLMKIAANLSHFSYGMQLII